jgi:hypothetical protein
MATFLAVQVPEPGHLTFSIGTQSYIVAVAGSHMLQEGTEPGHQQLYVAEPGRQLLSRYITASYIFVNALHGLARAACCT